MPDNLNTSFIPKKTSEPKTKVRRTHTGWFMSLAIIVFVLAVAGAIGVFAYTQILEGSIERKRAELEEARNAFEPGLIEELVRQDRRLKIAQNILDQHIAPSIIFEELSDFTISSVQFTEFSFSHEEGTPRLEMRGEGRSFESVALQSDAFGESELIRDPIFSDLAVTQNGNVGFRFNGALNESMLQYDAVYRLGGEGVPVNTDAVPEDDADTTDTTDTTDSATSSDEESVDTTNTDDEEADL